MTPIGERVTVVMPLNTVSRTNFVQMSTAMWSLSVASKPGGPAGLEQPLEARRPAAVDLAEDQVIHRRVANHARLGDDRRHVADAAAGVGRADRACQRVDALDAVLKRKHHRVGTDERRERGQRALGVVELHREEHDVDGTDRRRVVGGATRGRCTSPFGLRICRPRLRSASRCAPRARNVTSVPAAARRPPK